MEKSFLFKTQFSPYYNNAVVGGISSGYSVNVPKKYNGI